MFINISGRLMLINASIIIKRRKNKQIRIESMAAFVFISGIHRTNGSDNEQLFGEGKAKAKERPVCCGLFDLYQVVGTCCVNRVRAQIRIRGTSAHPPIAMA